MIESYGNKISVRLYSLLKSQPNENIQNKQSRHVIRSWHGIYKKKVTPPYGISKDMIKLSTTCYECKCFDKNVFRNNLS